MLVPAVIVHVLLRDRVEVRVLERGGGCDATARVEGYHAAEEVEAVFVELPGSLGVVACGTWRVCAARRCVYLDAQMAWIDERGYQYSPAESRATSERVAPRGRGGGARSQ